MTFANYEESRRRGEKTYLYKFEFGQAPEDRYGYTNAEKDVVFAGNIYKAVAITHGEITSSGTLDKAGLDVTMSGISEVAEVFRIFPPSYIMSLIIYQGHADDPDAQYLAIWAGRTLNCARKGSEVTLTGEPVQTMFKRTGLRRNYQRGCPLALYGNTGAGSCRAIKVAYPKTVSAVHVRNIITVAGFTENPAWFANGHLEWVSDKGRREIYSILSASDAGDLQLLGYPVQLTVGSVVKLFKGCDHTEGELGCGLHDNILNYGGQKSIPLLNPVGSTSMFS